MSRPTNPKLTTCFAIVTALVGPPLLVVVSNLLFGRSPTLAIQIGLQILFCGFAALVVWVVLRRERMSLQSIGIRWPTWATLISGIMLWGITSILTPLLAQPVLTSFGPTWGVAFALGVDLPFGIVMTIFYLWRRDLIANMIAHSGGGMVAMLTDVP